MPSFADWYRQQTAPQPMLPEQPSSFANWYRQQAPPPPAPVEPPPEEESPFQKFWKTFRETPAVSTTESLLRGTVGAASGLAKFSHMANEWAADSGIPVVSEAAKQTLKQLDPVISTLDRWKQSMTSEKEQGTPWARFKEDPVGTLPKMLFESVPYIGAVMVNAPAGIAGAAMSRTGDEYNRLKDSGVEPGQARLAASLVGTSEAILQSIVPARMMAGLDKDLIGRVVSQASLGAGTAALQHFPAVLADLATGLRDGGLTKQDFYDALEEGIFAAPTGALMGLPEAGFHPQQQKNLGPDALIRERLRDRVVVGGLAKEAGATDVTQHEAAWDKIYRKLVDKQAPVEINSEMEHAVERSRGAPMIARMPFEVGVFQTDHRGELVLDPVTQEPVQIARPLTEIMKGVNADHFRTLVVAEQDLELANEGAPGTQPARSLEDLNLLQQRLGPDGYAKLHSTANEWRDWMVKTTIDPLIEVGAMTPEDKASILAKRQFYAPMVKAFDTVDQLFGAGSKQFQGVGQPIKGRKTSFGPEGTMKVIDPIEVSTSRVIQISKFVERQRVTNFLVDSMRNNPETAHLVEDVQVVPVKKPAQGGGEMLIREQPKDTVFTLKDGKKNFVRLPEPMMEAVNSFTAKQLGFFSDKILSPMSRMARAGFTYAPDFALAATVKDQWEAFVFTPGLNPMKSFVPGISLVEGLVHMNTKSDLFKEYMQAGAGHGGLVAGDRRDIADTMALKLFGTKTQKAKQWLNPFHALREVGNALSEASRVGIFAARKRAGDTTQEARHWARYALTDFQRMGSSGEKANAIIAFWNAQVQGVDKYARTFNPAELVSKDAGKRSYAWQAYTKALVSVTLPSVLLWMKNHEDEDYNRLPTWEKNSYWHVGKFNIEDVKNVKALKPFLAQAGEGQYWLRIPKPFELGWTYGSLVERSLDYLKTHDQQQLKDTLAEFGGTLLPGVAPTATLPVIENWANKEAFFGTPVVPHGTENRPPEEQYTERTPQLIRAISAGAAQVPGAGMLPEAIDVRSPAKLKNLVHGYTGTLGRDVVSAADAAIYGQKEAGLPLDPRRLPILRRFTSPADPNLGAQPIKDMFETVNRVDGLATTVSSKVKSGNAKGAQEFAAAHPEYKGAPWLRKRRERYLDDRKMWERIRNNPNLDPQEKQRYLKLQEAKMVKDAEVTLSGWREWMATLEEKQ